MMNRRTALKNLSLSIGYVVSVPTIMSTFSSCTEDVATWQPVFFSEQEKYMVTNLVDIILPGSDTPGALDVNVPQFIDLMYQDIELEPKKKIFQKGAAVFANKFEEKFGRNIRKGKKEDIQKLFASYFDLPEAETKNVLNQQKMSESEISESDADSYAMYKFLFSVRSYTLFGYFTSEKVAKEVLNYDPIPGVYQGCIPLEDVGNAWAL
jgi:hypothetical protein